MFDSEMLLSAYRDGMFPMAVDGRSEIGWLSPDPRAIIPLDERFHIPHGVQRALKKKKFEITFDTEFDNVIRACATSHGKTWISEEIIQSYCELHRRGHAHSVESRLEGKLAGGLYGVQIGGGVFGESIVHHRSDSSSAPLVAILDRLPSPGFCFVALPVMDRHPP